MLRVSSSSWRVHRWHTAFSRKSTRSSEFGRRRGTHGKYHVSILHPPHIILHSSVLGSVPFLLIISICITVRRGVNSLSSGTRYIARSLHILVQSGLQVPANFNSSSKNL